MFIVRTAVGPVDRCSLWGLLLGQWTDVHCEDCCWASGPMFIVRTAVGPVDRCSLWGLLLGQWTDVHCDVCCLASGPMFSNVLWLVLFYTIFTHSVLYIHFMLLFQFRPIGDYGVAVCHKSRLNYDQETK